MDKMKHDLKHTANCMDQPRLPAIRQSPQLSKDTNHLSIGMCCYESLAMDSPMLMMWFIRA